MGNYVKSAHGDYDVKVPSQDQVTLNTVLSILGTAGFAGVNLRDFVGGLLGSGRCNGMGVNEIVSMVIAMLGANNSGHSEHFISRHEMSLEKQIAEKDSRIALLEANTFTDGKMLELYRYIDSKLQEQAVKNQAINDSILMVQNEVRLEAERRSCADNSIVNYVNATFYPKMVADVTVGTETTSQTVYNPLPICGCK